MHTDEYWMRQALTRAQTASALHEVPVGAVVVLDNQIIGVGYNCPIKTHDSSAHAEMIALRMAALNQKNYRLVNTTLYVTLEPCIMCAGALVQARVKRLVFGAYDPKAGAVVSKCNVLDFAWLNHRLTYIGGVLAEECGELLKKFFQERRA